MLLPLVALLLRDPPACPAPDYRLWYRQPVAEWNQALPVGDRGPSAFLPLAMSAAAVLTISVHVARSGAAPQADEAAAAHLRMDRSGCGG